MTRVDFHSNIADKIGYTCRLVRKARASGAQVVVWAHGPELAALDAALWTFSELDFIAHVAADDPLAGCTPVVLAAAQDDPQELPHHQILINLTAQPPLHFARFERLFEIVTPSAEQVASGRERYRYYQQRGYPLTHTVADKA